MVFNLFAVTLFYL